MAGNAGTVESGSAVSGGAASEVIGGACCPTLPRGTSRSVIAAAPRSRSPTSQAGRANASAKAVSSAGAGARTPHHHKIQRRPKQRLVGSVTSFEGALGRATRLCDGTTWWKSPGWT